MLPPRAMLACMALTLAAGAAQAEGEATAAATVPLVPVRPEIYAPVTLSADLRALSKKERRMLSLFIDAAEIMDGLFWQQTYGDRGPLLKGVTDARTRRFIDLNYGPWDRLAENSPFIAGVGAKPPGARFYPSDMSKEEFERADLPGSRSEYTVLRRDAKGALVVVPYHEYYRQPVMRAAEKLEAAAALADDAGLRNYLRLRAQALRTDDYRPSDRAWLDMKKNRIDLVVGPIETYEDSLFGYKAAYEAYVLVKDMEWSRRLAKYTTMLPELQRGLPVPDAYKAEKPGTDSDLNAYDAVYYAGHCNAASKTIAINLPNDEQIQLEKGTRRLQLKNTMRAKFDKILMPIGEELIAPDQRRHVTFDAFFAKAMFHEVAHGLGIKNTLDGKGTVRSALKEQASWLEEGKADILGLYMITRLQEKGEIPGSLEDYYVTFLTDIFRAVRWGAAEAHGQANMVRFNFFADRGAFVRDAGGHYRVNMPEMRRAMDELSALILKLQGDGDYDGVRKLLQEQGVIHPQLAADLQRLAGRSIPVDVAFVQGKSVLKLK